MSEEETVETDRPTSLQRFELVDPLRGLAAITILVYHAVAHFDWRATIDPATTAWLDWGWVGVDVFFVISGFVITLSAMRINRKASGLNYFRTFMKRRFARIAPLYYASLALFIAIFASDYNFNLEFAKNLITHLFFIHNIFYDYFGTINGANWSVATEMQFYLFVAVLIPFINSRNIIPVILTLMLTAFAWRYVTFVMCESDGEAGFYKILTKIMIMPGMLDEFSIGIGLAWFVNSNVFHKVRNTIWLKVLAIGSFCGVASLAVGLYGQTGSYWDNQYMVTFFRTLIALAVGSLILLLCCLRLNKFFKTLAQPFIYLGTISYGIYLFHLPVMLKVKELNMVNSAKLALTFVITLILASGSWHFFEKRFLAPR